MDQDTTKDLEEQPTVNSKAGVSGKGETRTRLSKFSFLYPGYRNPPPPKPSLAEADIIPEVNASWLSLLTFKWIDPLLRLGYSRPLEATDLYKLQDDRSSGVIAEKIVRSFEERQKLAAEYNSRLASGDISPGLKGLWWSIRGQREEREKEWREKSGKKRASLTLAVNDSVFWFFWGAGILQLIYAVALTTSTLLVKAIIRFAQHSYIAHRTGKVAPPLKDGIGLALGLFFLQALSSFAMNHSSYRATGTGILLRAGLITTVYNKALALSIRARCIYTDGKLVNYISADISRIGYACSSFHAGWTAPIQLIICLAILLVNLGPSALAGFAIFLIITPIQTMFMRTLLRSRRKAMVFTDKRSKLLQELLSSIKIIKFFAWEDPYLAKVHQIRDSEIRHIRPIVTLRATIISIGISLPVLASVIAFVVYGLNHPLDPATIFTSLTVFNMLRTPLTNFPAALSVSMDAYNALERIQELFEAESLPDEQVKHVELDNALELDDASFTWDGPPPEPDGRRSKGKVKVKDPKGLKNDKKDERRPDMSADTLVPAYGSVSGSSQVTISQEPEKADKVFKFQRTSLRIPKGKVVAIVGPVGSGKSSLLQGLIGEMRRESGSVKFCGSVSYCPQNAWIQNATIRENVCFGRAFDPDRYWQAISDSCLDSDLKLFSNGDLTEVGERGISLSGGQKQRINICRAIYCGADVQIFDDPLSALDTHVGRAVFQRVFANNPEGRTKILVTHALHFLPQVDYIYTISDGQIMERGTYGELMTNDGVFSKFVREFGSKQEEEGRDVDEIGKGKERNGKNGPKAVTAPGEELKKGKTIMQEEERSNGAVAWKVYRTYLSAGNGYILVPALLLSLLLMQVPRVLSSYWLVFWQEQHFHQPVGFYMGIYAALGVSLTITSFASGAVIGLLTHQASNTLHRRAITSIMHAPMSFFETTPLGRIMNRFSKDVDTIDTAISISLRTFLVSLANIIGSFVLIAIIIPWFLAAVVVVMIVYCAFALYYRASVRELKRLDTLLRSSLYAHFSESLVGLSTIRAYGETDRFRKESEDRINAQNRAYWAKIAAQRWLGIRVDMLSLLLTLVASILAVTTRLSISPSQIGVVLTQVITTQQSFSWLVRQVSELENNMNSVERVIHYARNIEQEPPHKIPDMKPKVPWPAEGRIEIKDVFLKYRPGLPDVLSGLTMDVAPGEKVGIVGRTGAGKSSIMTALYRLVELSAGSILIDGVDISKIGLKDLRSALAIIPQDPMLFSGTLRSNLDPFERFDDAELWDALRRSHLVDNVKLQAAEAAVAGKFTLDTVVEDGGSNLSVGQRSLVSLARALVKDAKVLILDEATASVDYETDRKVQDTITAEFGGRTILCIAHRLQTIIGYDKICVMDSGRIAEFDTPTELFNMEKGIFRGMCDRSGISLEDIRMAAKLREA